MAGRGADTGMIEDRVGRESPRAARPSGLECHSMGNSEPDSVARTVPPTSDTGPLVWLYEMTMAVLAVVNLALITEHKGWTNHVNIGIWSVFVVDYVVRILRAADRRAFFRQNLPDLVTLVPVDFFRGLRLLRLVRLVRALRGLEVLYRVGRQAGAILNTNGLGYVIIFTGLVTVAGAVLIREFEPGRLGTLGDALWWSLVTTTTVGYSGAEPTTPGGRAVVAVLWLVGIGTIGMITASIATYFLGGRRSVDPHVRHVQSELGRWDDMTHEERRKLADVLEAISRER